MKLLHRRHAVQTAFKPCTSSCLLDSPCGAPKTERNTAHQYVHDSVQCDHHLRDCFLGAEAAAGPVEGLARGVLPLSATLARVQVCDSVLDGGGVVIAGRECSCGRPAGRLAGRLFRRLGRAGCADAGGGRDAVGGGGELLGRLCVLRGGACLAFQRRRGVLDDGGVIVGRRCGGLRRQAAAGMSTAAAAAVQQHFQH